MAKPIIPWLGGKTRLAKHIIPLFPAHQCYVEAFAGAAALFYKKDPVKVEVLNDLNGELVNLYRVVKYHLEEFVHQFNYALFSRQMFEWAKMSVPETLTDIQRAARFYYLQKASFGGKVAGQTFGTATTSPPKLRVSDARDDLLASWERLSRVTIENLDWATCIKKYDRPHTLFYLDPPYYQTAGYGVEFGLDQFEKIADILRTMKGKAVVSVGDHQEMHRIFSGFNIKAVPITYTVGGAKNAARRNELIIKSWAGR
jgi:DNA adenine methylase